MRALRRADSRSLAQAREAVSQLASMARLGVQPDTQAATALIYACARNGNMEMAQAAFEELFGARPDLGSDPVVRLGWQGCRGSGRARRAQGVAARRRGQWQLCNAAVRAGGRLAKHRPHSRSALGGAARAACWPWRRRQQLAHERCRTQARGVVTLLCAACSSCPRRRAGRQTWAPRRGPADAGRRDVQRAGARLRRVRAGAVVGHQRAAVADGAQVRPAAVHKCAPARARACRPRACPARQTRVRGFTGPPSAGRCDRRSGSAAGPPVPVSQVSARSCRWQTAPPPAACCRARTMVRRPHVFVLPACAACAWHP